MKTIFYILLILGMTVNVSACNHDNDAPSKEEERTEQPGNKDGNNDRYLVLYNSRTGNTANMARTIQSVLDCDMLEVVPETPYDNDYNTMLERAQQELSAIRSGNYPAIKTSLESFGNYDIIFIGYPIWHRHMATTMQTFLHNHAGKLSGKRIALFASSGSSDISISVNDARSLVPDATFTETLHLTSGMLAQMESRP